MVRWCAFAFVVSGLVVGCKKKQEAEPDPAPSTAGTSGKSVTKIKDDTESGEEKATEGAAPKHAETPTDSDTGARADASLYGGNGSPPYRDEDGHLHGPGGPIFMGKGPECTDKINHCLRDGVWFAVPTLKSGNIYRATPAFQFENKWWTFREQEAEFEQLFKTKVIEKPGDAVVGSPAIFLVDDNYAKWLDNEHDALNSSRWEAGIIEAVNGDSLRISGWRYPIPSETVRVVVETKGS